MLIRISDTLSISEAVVREIRADHRKNRVEIVYIDGSSTVIEPKPEDMLNETYNGIVDTINKARVDLARACMEGADEDDRQETRQ